MKRILTVLAVMLIISASCNKVETEVSNNVNEPIVTGGVYDIAYTEAGIYGYVNLPSVMMGLVDFGVRYSTSSNPTVSDDYNVRHAYKLNSENRFDITIDGLEPNTKYYYCAFIRHDNGNYQFGNVRSFSTIPFRAAISVESSNIKQSSATISGKFTSESEITFPEHANLYYSCEADTFYDLKVYGSQKTFDISSDGAFSVDLNSLDAHTIYYYVVNAEVEGVEMISEIKQFTTESLPELVDLGLSVKWRSWNLGATSPEDDGAYYQWAGTVDVSSIGTFDGWDICPYVDYNGSYFSIAKYNTDSNYGKVDNQIVLSPEDDAAHVILGDKWRMPTSAEWEELMNTDNCTWVWTIHKGVTGYKVTSKKPGYIGNYIFLPVTGRYCFDFCEWDSGWYWSSSLNVDDPIYAYYCVFGSFYGDYHEIHNFAGRCDGQSIRPVFGDVPDVAVSSITLNHSTCSLMEGETLTLTATVYPGNATDRTVIWTSSDTSVALVDDGVVSAKKSGTVTITAKAGDKTATCSVMVNDAPISKDLVDLGLSVKWATCNLGASKPDDYGGLFQWAGTENVRSTSDDLYWNNCPYHIDSSDNYSKGWTKYVPSSYYWGTSYIKDNVTTLDLEDDVAHVKLGGSWRIPTNEEWVELVKNCTWTWEYDYDGTGTNGFLVVSNKPGFTNRHIFLSAAGYRTRDKRYNVNFTGVYWSSTLDTNTSPSYAYSISFDDPKIYSENCSYARYYGASVRPVSK